MITYNHEKYIARAIESVLSQSFTDFELVICDDYSTDHTWNIIQSFKDSRIRAYRNPDNKGMIINCILAIARCKGDYIAFLDGDDYWVDPRKLHLDLKHIGNADLIHSDYVILKDGVIQYQERKFGNLLKRNYIATCTAMIRREVARSVVLRFHWKMADYPLWLSCKTIVYRDNVSAVYRIGGMSGKNRWKFMKSANEIRRAFGGRSQYMPFIRFILSYVKKNCCR